MNRLFDYGSFNSDKFRKGCIQKQVKKLSWTVEKYYRFLTSLELLKAIFCCVFKTQRIRYLKFLLHSMGLVLTVQSQTELHPSESIEINEFSMEFVAELAVLHCETGIWKIPGILLCQSHISESYLQISALQSYEYGLFWPCSFYMLFTLQGEKQHSRKPENIGSCSLQIVIFH